MLKIFEANREREMTLSVERHKRIAAALQRQRERSKVQPFRFNPWN